MPTGLQWSDLRDVLGQVADACANNHFLNPAIQQHRVIALGDFFVQRMVAFLEHTMSHLPKHEQLTRCMAKEE